MSFLSQQEHVSDGTLQTVPFSIAFLDVADLHFYIGSDEVTTTVPVAGVLVQQVTQYQVSLTAPVPTGVVFSVRRVTPRTSVPHIFNNGAALFNAANTDENNTYALFIVQEVYEQSGLGPFPGISTIDGTELLYVTAGGVRKQLTLATLLDQAPDVVLDTFKAELANQTDPLKGAGMLGTEFGRTVADKLKDVPSIKDYEDAYLSGVNWSPVFNAAPDWSFVPAGTYNLSSSVLDKTFVSFGGVTLTGAGRVNIKDLTEDKSLYPFAAVDADAYPSTSFEYKSEPSLVVTKSGRVLCFYRVGDGHQSSPGTTGYLVYREMNRDSGTWGAIQTLVNRTGFDSRNQIAGVTASGRIIVAYYQCEYTAPGVINEATRSTKYRYSDDDGITWSADMSLSQYCTYPSLDNVPFGKFVQFSNGNLLISLYNYHTIITLKSTDGGATWGTATGLVPNTNPNITTVYTTPDVSHDNITESCIVKLNENRLVLTGRSIPTGLSQDGTAVLKYQGRMWTATTATPVGTVVGNLGKVYLATVGGTTSSTGPSHSSGTATDGSVTWQYVSTYVARVDSTAYSAGTYLQTYSAYIYSVDTAGTVGTSAPFASKLEGNETQLAYFKSDNGGTSWSSANYVTWTSATFRATTSPPKVISKGNSVDILWFGRSPDWTAYHVKMTGVAFWDNPSWAFSVSDGERRSRVARSVLSAVSDGYGWRIDCGYIDVDYLPNEGGIIASWYDNPSITVGKTTLYSQHLV